MTLEELQPDAAVRGILPDALATVVSVEWHGSDALTLVYLAASANPVDTQAAAARARAIVMEVEAGSRLRANRPRIREARL